MRRLYTIIFFAAAALIPKIARADCVITNPNTNTTTTVPCSAYGWGMMGGNWNSGMGYWGIGMIIIWIILIIIGILTIIWLWKQIKKK